MLLLLFGAGGGEPQTASPGAALRSWVVPAAAVVLGAITAQPAAAARAWTVPTPSVALGGVVATPAPAVRTWTANDATLLEAVPQTATPLAAVRSWVVPAATLIGEAVEPPPGAGGGYTPRPVPKRPGFQITVVTPPAIRDWVIPRVRVVLGARSVVAAPSRRAWVVPASSVTFGDAGQSVEPARRGWVVPEPETHTAPDPNEEMLLLLMAGG